MVSQPETVLKTFVIFHVMENDKPTVKNVTTAIIPYSEKEEITTNHITGLINNESQAATAMLSQPEKNRLPLTSHLYAEIQANTAGGKTLEKMMIGSLENHNLPKKFVLGDLGKSTISVKISESRPAKPKANALHHIQYLLLL